jgi:hypothetical protein
MPNAPKGERLAKRRRGAQAENQPESPEPRVKLGSLLAEIGREFGGVEVDIGRDKTDTEAPSFE